VSLKPVVERPLFRISPPPYVTAEIVEIVRGVVAGAGAGKADSSPSFQLGSELQDRFIVRFVVRSIVC